MAGVLCCAKYDNRVRGMQFLQRPLMRNVNAGNREECHQSGQQQSLNPQQPLAPRTPVHRSGFHPLAKKVEISSAGIAPSRMMRQRVPSSVRSIIVEGISRGEAPPSTIMLMRPCSWSRTCSALVHSEAPLRLADVAVIGMAAAATTANGILAWGTRNATLPVLAVTLRGSRDPAFTMMVSGPGQYFRARA